MDDKRASTASVQKKNSRPVQNLPDYIRYVAARSKAGFDKVHEEFFRIFDETSTKSTRNSTRNSVSQPQKPNKTESRIGLRSKWSTLLWSSTSESSLSQDHSFMSYIPEGQEEEDVESSDEIERSSSAPIVDNSSTMFSFDGEKFATSKDMWHSTGESINNAKPKSKPPIKARTSIQVSPVSQRKTSNERLHTSCAVENNKAHNKTVSNDLISNQEGYVDMGNKSGADILQSESNTVNNNNDDYLKYLPGGSEYTNMCQHVVNGDANHTVAAAAPPKPCARADTSHYTPLIKKSTDTSTFQDEEDTYQVPRSVLTDTHISRLVDDSEEEDEIYKVPRSVLNDCDENYDTPPPGIRHMLEEDDIYRVLNGPVREVPITIEKIDSDNEEDSELTDYANASAFERPGDCTNGDQEFFTYSLQEVVKCLYKCGLPKFARLCHEMNFDGKHFKGITARNLKEAPYELTWLHISRFLKIIKGWRPSTVEKDETYEVPPSPVKKQSGCGGDRNMNNRTDISPNANARVKLGQVDRETKSAFIGNHSLKPKLARASEVNFERTESAEDEKNSNKVGNDFFQLSVQEVVTFLNNAALTRLAHICEVHQFDGAYFREITADRLKKEPFQMNWFHISKFFKLIKKG
ncbi:uncharacterized protein LOC128245632 [Mya arenaria]|uniref:uncharacterized protein LOC128245632 n=1 Tax=Mya arenaria TaxID=6604 RepID=UPI0022E53718|nr:uncharacterized protein LOC128245632 [Mya arenaria]